MRDSWRRLPQQCDPPCYWTGVHLNSPHIQLGGGRDPRQQLLRAPRRLRARGQHSQHCAAGGVAQGATHRVPGTTATVAVTLSPFVSSANRPSVRRVNRTDAAPRMGAPSAKTFCRENRRELQKSGMACPQGTLIVSAASVAGVWPRLLRRSDFCPSVAESCDGRQSARACYHHALCGCHGGAHGAEPADAGPMDGEDAAGGLRCARGMAPSRTRLVPALGAAGLEIC